MALALHCTVEELLDRVSARELTEWIAYSSIEPFQDERQDLLLATVAAILVNANRDPDTSSEAIPDDFLPWRDKSHYETDDDEGGPDVETMAAMVEALNAAFGGDDLRSEIGERRREIGEQGGA